jgi:hypothetical protein
MGESNVVSILRAALAIPLVAALWLGGPAIAHAADRASTKSCTPNHEDRFVDWRTRRTDVQVSGAHYCEESEVRMEIARDTRCNTPEIVRCTLTGKKAYKRGRCAVEADPCERYE